MAITWTEDADSRCHLGPSVAQQCNIATFAASDYPTGGYTINPASFGMGRIRGMWQVASQTGTPLGVVWQFNKATNKLQAFWTGAVVSTALAEVTATTDFSGTTVMFKAEGF